MVDFLFYQALGIRRDDQFSTTMLSSVIETLMSEMDPCEGKFSPTMLSSVIETLMSEMDPCEGW